MDSQAFAVNLISPVFNQNRFFFFLELVLNSHWWPHKRGIPSVHSKWEAPSLGTSESCMVEKLPFPLTTDHTQGEGKGLTKDYQEEGQKTGHFATYHTDCTHSPQEGWFLLPTNLCSAACTCMIHFHHLYLCQNIDRYPCWCIPRWRDQQTQTGGEASFSPFCLLEILAYFLFHLFTTLLTVELKKMEEKIKKNTDSTGERRRINEIRQEKQNECVFCPFSN